MLYQNAYSGIKKIFSAEVIQLLGIILFSVASVMAALITLNMGGGNVEASAGLALFMLLFMITAAVLVIIGAILSIVGLVKAGNDEPCFKTALIFVIVSAAFSAVSVCFSNNGNVHSICETISKISDLLVTYYVIQGVISLADKLGDKAVSQKGYTLIKVIVAIYAVGIATLLCYGLILANTTFVALSAVLLIVSIVLSVISYILYLSLLAKAKKMLA